jgi:hypothetical protein
LGIMAGALKHIRDWDITRYMIGLIERLHCVDMKHDFEQQFVLTALKYMLKTGNIDEAERVEIAINFLKEGVEPSFVARNTGLELAVVLKLKAQHQN